MEEKKVYIESLGCQMNKSDAERMVGMLSHFGYTQTLEPKKADLLIISLGTNDNSYIEENISQKEELTNRFIDACSRLIEKERKIFPNLPILFVYGSLKEENVYPLIEKMFAFVKSKYKDVYIVKLPGDNSGLSNHSFVSYHEEMAKVLREKIVEILS